MVTIHSDYRDIVELLGGCPEEQDGNVVCEPIDFMDALENLKVYMDDSTLLEESEEITEKLAALEITPKQLLEILEEC